jgi:hypothetical protein
MRAYLENDMRAEVDTASICPRLGSRSCSEVLHLLLCKQRVNMDAADRHPIGQPMLQ